MKDRCLFRISENLFWKTSHVLNNLFKKTCSKKFVLKNLFWKVFQKISHVLEIIFRNFVSKNLFWKIFGIDNLDFSIEIQHKGQNGHFKKIMGVQKENLFCFLHLILTEKKLEYSLNAPHYFRILSLNTPHYLENMKNPAEEEERTCCKIKKVCSRKFFSKRILYFWKACSWKPFLKIVTYILRSLFSNVHVFFENFVLKILFQKFHYGKFVAKNFQNWTKNKMPF